MLIEAGIIGLTPQSVISMTENGDIESILIEGSRNDIIEQVTTEYLELPVLVGTKSHNDIIFFEIDRMMDCYVACSNEGYADGMWESPTSVIALIKSHIGRGGVVRILGKSKDKWFMNWLDVNPLEVKS